jgi:hypothetical protein
MSLGMGDSLPGADETTADDPLGVPATLPDEDGEGERPGDAVAMVAGVPTAPATPAAGRNGFPMMNANASTATATIPTAIRARRVVRRRLGAMPAG